MIQEELIRSTIVPVIIQIISAYYKISLQDAFYQFYNSNTEKCLADDDTGLFGQSPLYLVCMFIQEKDGLDKVNLERLEQAMNDIQMPPQK